MGILIIVLLSVLSSNQIFSQESEKEILDNFFEIYQKDTSKAVDYIYSNTKWIDSEGDSVKRLKSQLKQYEELVGEYFGEEFLYKGKLGQSFLTYIYLAKYERQPFRFTFEFYKANDKWIVYSFKFDDSFDDDLEEVIKYDYMQTKF
ncbi:hypothetical protein [Flagellimonas sp. S3867]|uniref:hypothetical protein n=1 Tax=Flagellimonas sp. S3867 TaxID=2768063 RepID=UPI001684471C|nr:hypothetical protein [Flagellimonas sp. S3867]